jgi:hypothetical protein
LFYLFYYSYFSLSMLLYNFFQLAAKPLYIIFTKISGRIAHNVPAVGDVLPARIRALRSKVQGWQNVAEQWRGNGAKRNDLAIA